MKKSLLAIAVISAATMASAEVKLSGDITVDLTSVNGERPTFNEGGSELNIDASQDIGGGNTVYAHVELELNGHNKRTTVKNSSAVSPVIGMPGYSDIKGLGGVAVDEGRVGIKGSWGDVRLGDAGNACDAMLVGGDFDQVLDFHAKAGCNDGNGGNQGIRYTSPGMGAVQAAVSYHPDRVPGEDEIAVGVKAEMANFGASIGYSTLQGSDVNTFALGLEGKFGDFTANAQYQDTDSGANSGYQGWEMNVNYDLASGSVYAGYGNGETTVANVSTDADGWMLGYTHNISDRTWTWIEVGGFDGDTDTSWSTGLAHKF